MSRELIEAAKAVLDLLDPNDCELLRSGARIGEWIRATDALRATVRAAEAAHNCDGDGYFTQRENTDAEKKAASQYADGLVSLSGDEGAFHGTRKNVHEAVRLAFLAGARSRDEAAPVADTVAVPIETLRELRLIATKPLTDQDCRNVCAAVRATVDALLPPPPAPEPSVPGDVIDQWNREAVDYANEQFPEPPEVNRAARYGYVAARRAEWVRTQKGGG